MKFTLNDTVIVLNDYSKEGVLRGDFGAIIEVYTQPDEAYEVEFLDQRGNTKALIVLHPNEISKLAVHGKSLPLVNFSRGRTPQWFDKSCRRVFSTFGEGALLVFSMLGKLCKGASPTQLRQDSVVLNIGFAQTIIFTTGR